MESLKLNK